MFTEADWKLIEEQMQDMRDEEARMAAEEHEEEERLQEEIAIIFEEMETGRTH